MWVFGLLTFFRCFYVCFFSVSYRGCFVNESARMEPRSFQRWDFKGRFCMILCGRFFFGCFFPPGFEGCLGKRGPWKNGVKLHDSSFFFLVFKILPPNNVATESYDKWRKGISLCKVLAVSLPNIFSQVWIFQCCSYLRKATLTQIGHLESRAMAWVWSSSCPVPKAAHSFSLYSMFFFEWSLVIPACNAVCRCFMCFLLDDNSHISIRP